MMITHHMTVRMQQRCMSPEVVKAILEEGVSNGRGDKISLDPQQVGEVLAEKRYALKQIREEIKGLERLQRRGGGAVVAVDDCVITGYTNSKRVRK